MLAAFLAAASGAAWFTDGGRRLVGVGRQEGSHSLGSLVYLHAFFGLSQHLLPFLPPHI